MLDEIFTQLSSLDKTTRLDAYQSLTAAMKKYSDLPKIEEFVRRVPALVDFVRRDFGMRKGDDHRDGQLAHEALKLATLLAWRHSSAMTEVAKEDVLDQCIEIVVDHQASKLLTNSSLFLLSCQSFNKILTHTRVNRIIKTLEKIDARISGFQVKVLRLDLYKKLVSQCPKLMVGHASSWLGPLMEGLLSERSDVASRALSCGREAAVKLGSDIEMSKAMEKLLNSSVPNRAREPNNEASQASPPNTILYTEVFVAKLQRLAKDKSRSDTVPQIWSVIVLFLQRRRSVLTRAPHKQHLLSIMQYCLNKVPVATKTRAMAAWRDLIYTLHPDMHTDKSTLELLSLIFAGAFQRNDGEKARKVVEATYITFLYYALWPKASNETVTYVWNKRVASLLKMDNPKSHVRSEFALRVLGALLGTQKQVAWDKEKAMHCAPLQPEDLPLIEPKWVAANIDSILDVLENHIKTAGPDPKAIVYTVWDRFNRCIVETRNHEIRPSHATMGALASILSYTLKHAAETVPSFATTPPPDPNALTRLSKLLIGTISTFGLIPCNEKVLYVDEHNIVHAAESAKSVDAADEYSSAIEIVLSWVMSACQLRYEPPQAVCDLFDLIIRRKLESATNSSKRLQILAELSQGAVCEETYHLEGCTPSHCLKATFWEQICKQLLDALKDYSSSEVSPDSQSRGADFQHVVTILVNGVNHESESKTSWFQAWNLLLKEASASLRESTNLAIANGVFEPIARGISEKFVLGQQSGRVQAGLDITCRVLRSVQWPEVSDTQQQAQKSLWGSVPANANSGLQDPYAYVYDLFQSALNLDLLSNNPSRTGHTVTMFIDQCPASFFWDMLRKLAPSLGRWLREKENDDPEPAYWSKLIYKLKDSWSFRPTDYQAIIRPILLAGLGSSTPEIAAEYVALWDSDIRALVSVDGDSELAGALTSARGQSASSRIVFSQSVPQSSPAPLPASQASSVHAAASANLSQSPGRREWLLSKSLRRQSPVNAPQTVASQPDAMAKSRTGEVQVTQNKSHSKTTFDLPACFLHGAADDVGANTVMNVSVPAEQKLDTMDTNADAEIPSSPPELPAEPVLPAVSSDNSESENRGDVNYALPMSDEFQDMDSSPTPFIRRPFSATRSDIGVFDFPDSSPIKNSNHPQAQSDPTGTATKPSKPKRQTRAKSSELRVSSVSSKHFPINLDEEAVPEPSANARSPMYTVQAARQAPFRLTDSQKEAIIDVDSIPERVGNKRKLSLSSAARDLPYQKGHGRPRSSLETVSASRQELNDMQESQPQKRGRGRPRKAAASLTRKSPSVATVQTSQPDEDMEDSIEVVQSQPQPAKQRKLRARISRGDSLAVVIDVAPLAPVAARRDDAQNHVEREASTVPSSSSVERIRDSFVEDDGPDTFSEKTTGTGVQPSQKKGRKKPNSSTKKAKSALENRGTPEQKVSLVQTVHDTFGDVIGSDEEQCSEDPEQEQQQEQELKTHSRKRKSLSSPSSQLQGCMDPSTPKKKRKISVSGETKEASQPQTPQSPLSKTAQNILAKLRGLLGDVQRAVLGRSEARATAKVLNDISAIVPQIGNAVLEAEERGENGSEA